MIKPLLLSIEKNYHPTLGNSYVIEILNTEKNTINTSFETQEKVESHEKVGKYSNTIICSLVLMVTNHTTFNFEKCIKSELNQ